MRRTGLGVDAVVNRGAALGDPILRLRRQPYLQVGLVIAACVVLLVDALRGGNWSYWFAVDGFAVLVVGLGIMIFVAVARPSGPGRWIAVVPLADLVGVALIWPGVEEAFPSAALLFLPPLMWLGLAFPLPMAALGVVLVFVAPAVALARETGASLSEDALANLPLFPLIGALVTASAYVVGRLLRTEHEHAAEAFERVLVTMRSQRDQAEVFRSVLDASPNAIAVITPRGRILHRNDAFDALVTRAGLDVGTDWSEGPASHVYGEDRSSRVRLDRKLLARVASSSRSERRTIWVGAPGDQRAMSVTVRPIARGDEPIGAAFIAADITSLVDAVDVRDRFLDIAGHELRTPLTVLLGELDLLDLDGAPPQQNERLARIEAAAMRLREVVDKVIAAGRQEVSASREVTDAALIVTQAVANWRPAADEMRVDLTVREMSSFFAYVDSYLLRRALEELLSNALRFTPPGGAVRVSVERDGERPVIVVTDTGIGMTAGEQRRMFEKFYRTDSAHRSQIPGSGLGLHIVRTICDQCGIDVSVRSTPGRGTSVRLALPPAAQTPRPGRDRDTRRTS